MRKATVFILVFVLVFSLGLQSVAFAEVLPEVADEPEIVEAESVEPEAENEIVLDLETEIEPEEAEAIEETADTLAVEETAAELLATEGDYEYEVNSDGVTATLTRYNGSGGDIVLPVTLGGYAVTKIGGYEAFFGRRMEQALTSVVIPDGYQEIGYMAFCANPALTSVILPDSLVEIGPSAFIGSLSLSNITLPDNLKRIASTAFAGTALTSIEIPKNVEEIGWGAFGNCDSLGAINVDTQNQHYYSEGGVVFTKDKKTLVVLPSGKANYTVPSYVESIGSAALHGCSNMNIIVSKNVSRIEHSAFAYIDTVDITFLNAKTIFPDELFGEGTELWPETITIRGYEGSTAQTLAQEEGFRFISLGAAPIENISVTGVKLSYGKIVVARGKTNKNLKATVSPSNASNKAVTWKSENTKIAKVNKTTGVVTGVKNGTTKVVATTTDGKKVAKCTVVVGTPVTKAALNKTKATIITGKTVTLKATLSPKKPSVKGVTWKSSNTKIATVNSKGVVKGIKKGTATITATAKDGSGKKATCKITVRQSVTKVALNTKAATIKKNKTVTLKATISPSNAGSKAVTWKSSNPKVATVTSKGKVKGIKKGTVTITATAKDGSKKKAMCKVTVK